MENFMYVLVSLFIVLAFAGAAVAANEDIYSELPSSSPASPRVDKQALSEEESLRNLQKDMLDLFGHKDRPRPGIFSSIGRTASSAKKYMLTLYNSVAESRDDMRNDADVEFFNATGMLGQLQEDPVAGLVAKKADTIVSFVNHGFVPRPNITDEQGAMYFDVSSNLVVETTLAAELRLYLDVGRKKTDDNVLRVTAYQIRRPRSDHLPLSSRVINASASGWHEFDILSATKLWKEHPASNHGVFFACSSVSGMQYKFSDCGLVDFLGNNDYRPFLVAFYQSGNEDEILAEQIPEAEESKIFIHQRIRRSLKTLFPKASEDVDSYTQDKSDLDRKKRDDANQLCRRHALYIGFKDLGWSDWIIAPNGFKAEYCRGECSFPLSRDMNATNHAIIQTLVHLMSPTMIPEPSCAPLRLHPLQVLYLDDNNNVVMKKYANMIVKDCGCQ